MEVEHIELRIGEKAEIVKSVEEILVEEAKSKEDANKVVEEEIGDSPAKVDEEKEAPGY